jgi:guanine deaminase
MDKHEAHRGHGEAQEIDRRQTLVAFGSGLVMAATRPQQSLAGTLESPPLPSDQHFMRMAIAEAQQADFPFGAVIVRDGEVLSKGRNLGKITNDPTAHGEMVAIRRFVAVRPAAELKGTTLYATGEPCPMCMGAILWCGIIRVVFGASIEELAAKLGQIMLNSRTVANAAPFAKIAITGGLLSAEALALFRD